jgi:hypothetical protein
MDETEIGVLNWGLHEDYIPRTTLVVAGWEGGS